MATTTTPDLVNASHLLAQADATIADASRVASQHADWRDGRPLLVVDGGQLLADIADLSWAKAFLSAAASQRRESRIERADQELTAAHEAVLLKNRGRRGQNWESEMLDAFRQLTAALVELVDAREDAGAISADRANRLRVSAKAQLRETEEIGIGTARKAIRLARGY
jgi:hypothetical protein